MSQESGPEAPCNGLRSDLLRREKLLKYLCAVVSAFLLVIPQPAGGGCEDDRDCDGLTDFLEDSLGTHFCPPIWADNDEWCGPLSPSGWCVDGEPHEHLRGYIGYDVVEVGFSDLYAIEYTAFFDYDGGLLGAYAHVFDAEGFTVLVQRRSDSFELISIQSFSHQTSSTETSDRYYSHEIDQKYWTDGVMIAHSKHGVYMHDGTCERCCQGEQGCNHGYLMYDPLNPEAEPTYFRIRPLDAGPYPACSVVCQLLDVECMINNDTIADCWAELVHLSGYGVWECPEPAEPKHHLRYKKKHIPPWIPIEIELPENLSYVDIWELPNMQAQSEHLTPEAETWFGSELINRNMPLRLICYPHPHYEWWYQYFDPHYQLEVFPEDIFGLEREVFEYEDWQTPVGDMMDIKFADLVHSFILHGLPGTIVALYDGGPDEYPDDWTYEYYVIPDGARVLEVADVSNHEVDFVSWGFGPTADAGNDTMVECGETVVLDGRGSYEFPMDLGVQSLVFENPYWYHFLDDWYFLWVDHTYPGMPDLPIGSGEEVYISTLPPGEHKITLTVLGERWPYSHDPSCHYRAAASDTVVVRVNPTSLVITSPNGDETLQGTCKHLITWCPPYEEPYSSGSVTLKYSLDNGSTWDVIAMAAPNTGWYEWGVPSANSSQCLVSASIVPFGGSPISDQSDATFEIATKALQLDPLPNTVGISRDQEFTIQLDTKIDAATFSGDDVLLHSSQVGYIDCAVELDSAGLEISVMPLGRMPTGASVEIIIFPGNWSAVGYGTYACAPFIASYYVESTEGYDSLYNYFMLQVANSTSDLIASDFDGDGDIDVATLQSMMPRSVHVFFNNGDATFAEDSSYSIVPLTGNLPGRLAITNADQDSDPDIMVTNYDPSQGHLTLLRNDGQGEFNVEFVWLVDYPTDGSPSCLTAGKLWRGPESFSRELDAVVVDHQHSLAVTVPIEESGGVHQVAGSVSAGAAPVHVLDADLDGDGDLDIVTADDSAYSLSLLYNDGWASFPTTAHVSAGESPDEARVADLDRDHDVDMVSFRKCASVADFYRLVGNGTGDFSSYGPEFPGIEALGFDIGEVNGDAFMDLVFVGREAVSVLLNREDGTFGNPIVTHIDSMSQFILPFCADYDGDGGIDIACIGMDYFDRTFLVILLKEGLISNAASDDQVVLPANLLHQNFPNPFNSGTLIRYTVERPTRVRLSIFNVLGQTVNERDMGEQNTGVYDFYWDGTDRRGSSLPSGIYFYRLTIGDYCETKKMLLLK